MIRLATTQDAEALLEIYRPSIEESVISFETELPSPEEMRRRIESCLGRYPWIVAEADQDVLGYAYAGVYHQRAAYRWAAQVSVYVAQHALRQGVARRLYQVLFALLEAQGIRKVLAAITVPNEASQRFHESLGFELVGVAQDVGYKFGQWRSMGWWQRPLGEGANSEPAELVPFEAIARNFPADLNELLS